MNAKDFLLALDEMLELDPGTLDGTETLADVPGWDSLAVVSFVMLVDENLGRTLEGGELAKAKTVRDLLAIAGIA